MKERSASPWRPGDGHERAEAWPCSWEGSGEEPREGRPTGNCSKIPPPSCRRCGGSASRPWPGDNGASTLRRPDEKTKARRLSRTPPTEQRDVEARCGTVLPQENPQVLNWLNNTVSTACLVNTDSTSARSHWAKEDAGQVRAHNGHDVRVHEVRTGLCLTLWPQ